MTEEKNPYAEMPQDVLEKHLGQLKAVIEEKKVDVTQFFGEPITKEDKEKLEKVDDLNEQVKKLSETAGAKELSENENKLALSNIDRVVNDIKKIDKDAPLDKVLNSNFNNMEKLSILSDTQGLVEHYTGQISTLREEFGNNAASQGTQTFSKPQAGSDSAEAIIKSMVKAKED